MAKKIKKDASIEEKLKALYDLQQIDSQIDKLRVIRGELPLEVQDLEDEIAGLEKRIEKYVDEVEELEKEISGKKNLIEEAKALIKKYEADQNNVRNNREFDALTKEIEFQKLEIELAEKRIREFKAKIDAKEEKIKEAKALYEERKADLEAKKTELEEITEETAKEEEALLKKSEKAASLIEERLLKAYQRIRNNARNGLAVVTVQRDSCGGCFAKVPPQRQLDIKTHKKIIVCEHCGRILVDASFDPNYVEPVKEEKPKKKRTTRRKKAATK